MTTMRAKNIRIRPGVLVLAVLTAVLAAGCGTLRPGDDAAAGPSAKAAVATPVPTPSAPLDFRCPGEDPTPTPTMTQETSEQTQQPPDHYAENHGFMVPFPLHGQNRCDGLTAVRRIRGALEPLRERGDFDPASTLHALGGLGYDAGKTRTYQNGTTGVGFLIEAPTMCLEGTMNRDTTQADAFNGYPDHPGCERPSGGH